MMHLILGVVVGILGASLSGVNGGILGCLLGVLAAEVLALRKRIDRLEKIRVLKKSEVTPKETTEETEEEVVFRPVQPLSAQPATLDRKPRRQTTEAIYVTSPASGGKVAEPVGQGSFLDPFFDRLGVNAANLTTRIVNFFTTGNLVLKIGIIILFFGVAFLLKYAAQRNMIPIELRLAGVSLAGMALLGVGWRLRLSRTAYGLTLQGGGVGILYLVIFAAARLYDFLPLTLSLVVMIGLVVLSCMLAVLQESRALAVFGIAGGFLAPVLMSTDGGSHVLLFSYYALLNAGILGIAWFKSWRELNLVGFVFTFAIGTLWGSTGYRPEFFSSTEPFLVLFFVFYVLISILFAQRQPVNLRGFIDGPLVFGLPLIVSGLQYCLVKDFQYGMALSALALGLFYLALATLLWRRLVSSMHLLCEAFFALGVVFGSLAIPLALDGHWSATIWALEGAGMVWVGGRQKRVLARLFGLLLQLAAGYIFLGSVWYPFVSTAFINRYFLGCLFLSLAALSSSYFLDRYRGELKHWERYLSMPFMILGLIWWYIGGLREVHKHMPYSDVENGFLLYCSLSSVLVAAVVKKLLWPRFGLALYLQLPVMIIILPVILLGSSLGFHLFSNWGAEAWITAFVVQYRILYLFDGDWPRRNRITWHLGTLWLLLFVLSHESSWAVDQLFGLGKIWTIICWALVPSGALLLILRLGRGLSWPVGRYASDYLGAGGVFPAFGLLLWTLISFGLAGNPQPLPYIPVLNPVELSGLFAIGTLVLWLFNRKNNGYALKFLPEKQSFLGLAVLFFFWLNSVVARSVHFYAGIPYHPHSLYRSVIFEAALAALWGFGALAITVWAAKKGSRTLWGAGAALLVMVVLKLFIVDLSGTGTIARIVSFLVVGVLMLIIGYFSPLPPKIEVTSP